VVGKECRRLLIRRLGAKLRRTRIFDRREGDRIALARRPGDASVGDARRDSIRSIRPIRKPNGWGIHGAALLKVPLDAAGNPIPGYTSNPIKGDQYDAQVRWPGGRTLAALAGQQIKLRFSLVNTDLYAYRIG